MDNNLNNNNSNQDNSEERKSNFSEEFEEQKNSFDAEKFAKQQEQYRQMLPDANQNPDYLNPYQWRIGFGRRLGAYLIDGVFFTLVMVIAAFSTGIADELMDLFPGGDFSQLAYQIESFTEFTTNRIVPLTLAVTFVYYSLEVIFAQTPGKMLLGIIIGTDDKKLAPYSQLFMRFAMKNLSSFLTLAFVLTAASFFYTMASIVSYVILIGCLFVFGLKKQALHDMIAKTAVYFKDELEQFNKNNEQQQP